MPFAEDSEMSKEECRRHEVAGEGWAVVLHDDDVHEMREILKVLRDATGLSHEAALEVTWQASHKGQAIVTIATRERAREIVRQLRGARMLAELRPF